MRNSRRLSEKKKPGGPITRLGAKRIVDPSSAMADIRTSLADAEGEISGAADELGVSPRTLYNYISDNPSLERMKDKLDDESEKKNNDKQAEAILTRIYQRLLREMSRDVAPEQGEAGKEAEDFAKKIVDKLSAAGEDGVGVVTQPYDLGGVKVVLYKTNVFVGNILASLDTESGKGGDLRAIADATDKSVLGMITLDEPPSETPCAGAMVVKYIFSREGYGPTLYEIGMQLSPSGRIISDRTATSDEAAPVYMKMHSSRPDIKKIPLDDIKHGDTEVHRQRHTPSPADDCEVWYDTKPEREFLDYAFQGSGNVDLHTLKKNHRDAMKMLRYYVKDYLGWGPDVAENYLSAVADHLFMVKYHSIPLEKRGLKNM